METEHSFNWGKAVTALGLLILVVGAGLFLNGLRNRAEVIEAVRVSASEVSLSVGSCNQDPTVEVEETEAGTYEVLVRTSLPGNGTDCADGLTISVDPAQETVTIIDRVSGETFELVGD